MSNVSVSEARAILPELLDRVLAGEEVTLTRHGRAIAVMVRPDALRTRRADSVLAAVARLQDMLDSGLSVPLAATPTMSAERAEALLTDIRESRSGR